MYVDLLVCYYCICTRTVCVMLVFHKSKTRVGFMAPLAELFSLMIFL